MLWKTTTIQLQKGSIYPFYGDSVLFFKLSCRKHNPI